MLRKNHTLEAIILDNYKQINKNMLAIWMKNKNKWSNSANYKPELIVVSKKQPMENISPLINLGCNKFAENNIKEASAKWTDISIRHRCELHYIGNLQSNKTEDYLKNFDVIQTVDRLKMATKFNEAEKSLNLKRKYFIQINIATEAQKSGVPLNEASDLIEFCLNHTDLQIIGLMCLPPLAEPAFPYFGRARFLQNKYQLPHLSMGTSKDFQQAVEFGATHLRIGQAIFANASTLP